MTPRVLCLTHILNRMVSGWTRCKECSRTPNGPVHIAVVPRYFGRIGAAPMERYLLPAIGVRPFRCVNCDARFYRLKHSDGPDVAGYQSGLTNQFFQSLEKNLITGPASNLNFSTSGTEP